MTRPHLSHALDVRLLVHYGNAATIAQETLGSEHLLILGGRLVHPGRIHGRYLAWATLGSAQFQLIPLAKRKDGSMLLVALLVWSAPTREKAHIFCTPLDGVLLIFVLFY